jgi:hypothetical protein
VYIPKLRRIFLDLAEALELLDGRVDPQWRPFGTF